MAPSDPSLRAEAALAAHERALGTTFPCPATPEAVQEWASATGSHPMEVLIAQCRDESLRPETRQRAAAAVLPYLYPKPEAQSRVVSTVGVTPLPPLSGLSDSDLEALEGILAKATASAARDGGL